MGVISKTTEQINALLDKVENMPSEGVSGKTPVLQSGTTTTLSAGLPATSEVVKSGEDEDGNPIYVLNFGIPKGRDGSNTGGGGEVGSTIDWGNVLNKPAWVESLSKPTYTAAEVGALSATTEFKTINGESILGNGNISIDTSAFATKVELAGKQDILESGQNIKTINGQSLLGSGNINIEGGSGGVPTIDINGDLLDALTSNSSSEDVSSAVGGVDGLTALAEAANSGTVIFLTQGGGLVRERVAFCVGGNTESVIGISFMCTMFSIENSAISVITITYDKETSTFAYVIEKVI